MTRYEELTTKADVCRLAAARTEGSMKTIWLQKAMDLEIEAANLPVVKAVQVVR